MRIVDVSNPGIPVLLGKYSSAVGAISVKDNYVYAAGSTNKLLDIIDIADPMNPILAGTFSAGFGNISDICIKGNYAYVSGNNSGLLVVDLVNTPKLVLAGKYSQMPNAVAVDVAGDYAYVLNYNAAGLYIINISNPGAPKLVKTLSMSNMLNIVLTGNYAYIVGLSGLQIIDVTDPKIPKLVGRYSTGDNWVHSIFVSGNRAYFASGDYALHIVDVSNPKAPVLIGKQFLEDNTVGGIYFKDNYVYLGRQLTELRVINVAEPMQYDVSPFSQLWRVKLEVLDKTNKKSQATRDVWLVPYNHPPSLEDIELVKVSASQAVFNALGATDPDLNTTWDGLLEYRWDFDSDGSWDTKFSAANSTPAPKGYTDYSVTCQVKDRFGAASQLTKTFDSTPPEGSIAIERNLPLTRYSFVFLNLSATDSVSGGTGLKANLSNDGLNWEEFDYTPPKMRLRWSLSSGDGEKTILVKFTDPAGNISNASTVKIFRDSTKPLIDFTPVSSSLAIAGKASSKKSNLSSLIFSANVSDNGGSGVKKVSVYWRKRKPMELKLNKTDEELPLNKVVSPLGKTSVPTEDNTYENSLVLSQLEKGSQYDYYVAAMDNAGNWRSTPLYSFTVIRED